MISHLKRLRKSWQLFLSFTHKKSWHISKSDIASWVSDLRSQHLSPETINLRLAALSSFYTYVTQTYTHLSPEGVEQPLYHYNPVKASIPTERTCPSGVLSADEFIIFLTKSGELISTPINFIIHNRGLGQIKWNIGENPPVDWLSMSPKNGISTPLYSTPISSSINDDVISSGVYNTTLKISTGAGTKNSPLSIPIRVISKLEDLSLLEGNALVSLYVATQGSSWTNNTDWLDTNKPCSWYGVDCSAGHVSRLNLTNNNLVGTIPNVLSDITNLDHLDLSSNPLTGSLPLVLPN